jgi:ERCC4-type nuclease
LGDVLILIDTREQNQDYIESKLTANNVESNITCLSYGVDYIIIGTHGSMAIQRKTFPEVAIQMQEIREGIVPALLEVSDNPVLLVEETMSVDEKGMCWRKEGNFLRPAQLSARQYYNFLNSVRQMGCEVITTRNLDQSIWWMYSTHSYLHEEHYPKSKKKYGVDMQALGCLCCFNGIGQTTAKKVLQKHSLRDLVNMNDLQLAKTVTMNQAQNFRKVVDVRMVEKK